MSNLKVTVTVSAAAAALLLVAGCGSSSGGGGSSSSRGNQQFNGNGQGGFGVPQRFSGAFGKIAAISGRTMQVQNRQAGQVAVSYTSRTSFTQEVTVSANALKVGDCVTVGSLVASASPGSSPSAPSSSSTSSPIQATTVRISAPVKGSCTAGFGGQGRFRPGQRPSGVPTNLPTNRPSGTPSFGGGFRIRIGGAFGAVTAVSGSSFTVKSSFGGQSGTTRSTVVDVSSKTTFTETSSASSKALKVGECVQATGKTDSTGAVTASRIEISSPVNGQCSVAGLGGTRGGFGGGFGSGSSGQQGQAS